MADFTIIGGSETLNEASVGAFSAGTLVTSSATAQTKGAWTELEASTGFDYKSLTVSARRATTGTLMYEIGIGAGGSEEVIIEDTTLNQNQSAFVYGHTMCFPIDIPKGSRISARVQSGAAGASSMHVLLNGWGSGFLNSAGVSRFLSIGSDPSITVGTLIDPGAVANTDGAWTEIEASTAADFKCAFMVIDPASTTLADNHWKVDVGIGGSGSEVELVHDMYLSSEATTLETNMGVQYLPIQIPKGTRVAVRCLSGSTDINKRRLRVMLLGGV